MDNFTVWTLSGGAIIGLVFGIVMQRSRFCMVAAVTNVLLMRDYRHVQAFLAAWAVAIAGTISLESLEIVSIAESRYRIARIDWFGAIAGGLVFGFGAALAGGCASRTLVSSAEGHLGSLLSLISMAIFAGMTFYGSLEPLRVEMLELTAIELQTNDSGIAALLGMPAWIAGAVVSIGCLVAIRFLGSAKENLNLILSGAMIGLLIVTAWVVTGWLAHDPFESSTPSSAAIAGPLSRFYYSLTTGSELPLAFGTAFVVAVFTGALFSSLLSGRFTIINADTTRIPHHIIGGALMGIGAITAGGCNIGQGISGVSALSITSILAATSMFFGTVLGVKWWERRIH